MRQPGQFEVRRRPQIREVWPGATGSGDQQGTYLDLDSVRWPNPERAVQPLDSPDFLQNECCSEALHWHWSVMRGSYSSFTVVLVHFCDAKRDILGVSALKTPQEQLDDFFTIYDAAGEDQQAYAMHIWSITAELGKGFGTLQAYLSDDSARVLRFLQILRQRALSAGRSDDPDSRIHAECTWAFIKYLATLEGKDLSRLEHQDIQNGARMFEMITLGRRLASEACQPQAKHRDPIAAE